MVALLMAGSAISLYSCGSNDTSTNDVSYETLMTELSQDLRMTMSENGRPSYIFETVLVEGYGLAREPYREFREGVKIVTYSDSLNTKDATLTANYAIYYDKRKLWEAKGDVVVIKEDGKELYTQQLFWNSTTQRIYSNVDTKIVDTTKGDTYIGEGFESDEQMNDWKFRKMKGRMNVDMSSARPKRDTTEQARGVSPKSSVSKEHDGEVADPQASATTLKVRGAESDEKIEGLEDREEAPQMSRSRRPQSQEQDQEPQAEMKPLPLPSTVVTPSATQPHESGDEPSKISKVEPLEQGLAR